MLLYISGRKWLKNHHRHVIAAAETDWIHFFDFLFARFLIIVKKTIIIVIILYDYIHGNSVNEIMQFVITRFVLNLTDPLQEGAGNVR